MTRIACLDLYLSSTILSAASLYSPLELFSLLFLCKKATTITRSSDLVKLCLRYLSLLQHSTVIWQGFGSAEFGFVFLLLLFHFEMQQNTWLRSILHSVHQCMTSSQKPHGRVSSQEFWPPWLLTSRLDKSSSRLNGPKPHPHRSHFNLSITAATNRQMARCSMKQNSKWTLVVMSSISQLVLCKFTCLCWPCLSLSSRPSEAF